MTMYRLMAIAIFLFWASMMTALVARDMWPAWTAQDAPPMTIEALTDTQTEPLQYGISSAKGDRIGTAWSEVRQIGDRTSIHRLLLIDGLRPLPTVRVKTEIYFDDNGDLERFEARVVGIPMRIHIHGEQYGRSFPVEMHLDTIHRKANLDLAASKMIGDSFQPFTMLPELKVGQRWRMQMLDPLSAALGGKPRFRKIVAEVTATEVLDDPDHPGQKLTCFVVETSPQLTRALVDAEGRVMRQEADVPMLGRVIVTREPLRQDQYKHFRQGEIPADEDQPGGAEAMQ